MLPALAKCAIDLYIWKNCIDRAVLHSSMSYLKSCMLTSYGTQRMAFGLSEIYCKSYYQSSFAHSFDLYS